MTLGLCGHDHGDDLLQAKICAIVRQFRLDGPACIVVMREEEPPAGSMNANVSDMANFMLAIGELVLRRKRPSDCAGCAEAFDRVEEAFLLLSKPRASC